MDIEDLRSAINAALQSLSAEAIAASAGGITAKSVLNFAKGDVHTPQRAQRQSLERWVTGRTSYPIAAREAPAVREGSAEFSAGEIAGHARAIRRLLALALDETDGLLASFASWKGGEPAADDMPPVTQPSLREKGDALLSARQAQAAAAKRKAPPRTG
mgnify:CR=1 FL=1